MSEPTTAVEPATVNKEILKSRTFWFGLITAIAPLFPSVLAFITDNAAALSMIWGVLIILLRWITKDRIILRD